MSEDVLTQLQCSYDLVGSLEVEVPQQLMHELQDYVRPIGLICVDEVG